MDLKKIWIIDPVSGQASISLTLLVLSSLLCVIAMGLEMSGVISNTSMSFEFFGASSALYFGRRWNSSKGQAIDVGEK